MVAKSSQLLVASARNLPALRKPAVRAVKGLPARVNRDPRMIQKHLVGTTGRVKGVRKERRAVRLVSKFKRDLSHGLRQGVGGDVRTRSSILFQLKELLSLH